MGNGNPIEGRRARFIKKIVGSQGGVLGERPKQIARLAGNEARIARSAILRSPDVDAQTHLREQDHIDAPDVEDNFGFEPTDEKPQDVLIDKSIFAQYSQTRQLLRRDVALREEIDKREQPDPELEFDPDHVSGFIEEEAPLEVLQGKVASRTRYDKELAGDHTNDQND